MLGNEKAVSLREGQGTLDLRQCWVDAFAFETLVARIDDASYSGRVRPDKTRTANLAAKAIALYRGPFLPGEGSPPWVVAMRERLRSKFLRVVGFFGRYLEREGRWAEAIACYRKGLEVDDLAEEFYQRLMICHHRVGQVAEAAAAYNRCRKALSSMLGISPSPGTEAIAKGIRPS
jgi:two-component SAPR family response regulator